LGGGDSGILEMLLVGALVNWGINGGLLAHGDAVVGSGCGNMKVALARQGAATACDSFRSEDSLLDDMLYVILYYFRFFGVEMVLCSRVHNQLSGMVRVL